MTIDTASLLAVSSELFGKYDIITLPESANYECQETLNVLLYAATSQTNSLESASKDVISKNPDLRIPSADTIFNYIKENKIEDILSSFRKMNSEIFKMMKLENDVHDIAIDCHDIPFYGDKNTPGIRGIKRKSGSSWGKSFCTLDIIGTSQLTIDVIDINPGFPPIHNEVAGFTLRSRCTAVFVFPASRLLKAIFLAVRSIQ